MVKKTDYFSKRGTQLVSKVKCIGWIDLCYVYLSNYQLPVQYLGKFTIQVYVLWRTKWHFDITFYDGMFSM